MVYYAPFIHQKEEKMVKIRMRRTGCTNHATYRIVAADSRSPRDGKFLEILGWYDTNMKENNFKTEVGPGVYDIHSPRVPSVDELVGQLTKIREKTEDKKLWVNPDCGLKTRGDKETKASLINLVKAAEALRSEA